MAKSHSPMTPLLLAFALTLFAPRAFSQYIVTTVAGGGTGAIADGIPATAVDLGTPGAIVTDSAGNLYLTEFVDQKVLKIDSLGIIHTVAGNGSIGYSGNNGPATAASLNYPYGLAFDGSGNLYISDNLNYVIRKLAPDGIITTIAGNASAGYAGDNGPATDAKLNEPFGLTFDNAGNLYVADFGNNTVRKITPSGIISTVAGNIASFGYSGNGGPATDASLFNPIDVAVDAHNNLLIADDDNSTVRIVSLTTGIIQAFAGRDTLAFGGDGGPATAAWLSYPTGVCVDTSGNVLIADAGNNRIRGVSALGIINTVAGNGSAVYPGDNSPATAAGFNLPNDVTTDRKGNIYVADSHNRSVRKLSLMNAESVTDVVGNNIEIQVFPNPAADYVNIRGGRQDQTSTADILDMNGRTIASFSFTGTHATLNFQTLAKGNYSLRLQTDHRVYWSKVVKN